MNTLLWRGTAAFASGVLLCAGLAPASVAHATDGDITAPISTHVVPGYLLGVFGTTVVATTDEGGVFLKKSDGSWTRTRLDPKIEPTNVTWVGDGKLVALSSADGQVQILDVATNKVTTEGTDPAQVRAASPDFEVDLLGSSVTTPQPVKKEYAAFGSQIDLAWPASAAPTGADTAKSWIDSGWVSATAWVAPTVWVDSRYRLTATDVSYLPLDGSAGFVRRVAGDVLWATNTDASVRYVSLENKTLKDCTVTSATVAAPVCKTIKTKVSGSPLVRAFGSTLGITIGSTSYLWTTKLVKVSGLPSTSKTAFTGGGTTPALSVWGSKLGFYTVDGKGKATQLASGVAKPAMVYSLDLGTGYLVGTDSLGRDRGWARKLTDTLGDTVVLSSKAHEVATSGARYSVNGGDGLALYNGGTRTAKLSGARGLIAQSGPFSLVQSSATTWQLRKDAKVVASGTTTAVGLFGSLVAEVSSDQLTVKDYSTSPATTVGERGVDSDQGTLTSGGLWGDWVMLGYTRIDPDDGTTTSTTVVVDYTDPDLAWSRTLPAPSLGDGVVTGYDGSGQPVVWDFRASSDTAIPGTLTAGPVASGTGAVAWATQDKLVVSTLDGNAGGASAARALAWSSSGGTAASPFRAYDGWRVPWTLSVEATKAVEGTLKISDADGVVKSVPVTATTDGVFTVTWDGTLENGDIADGNDGQPYTWELDVAGKDGSGPLRQLVDDAKLTGTINVENSVIAFPLAKPRINDTTPVVGEELESVLPKVPDWIGDSLSYSWYCGKTLVGGDATYRVAPACLGQTVTLKVAAFPPYYSDATPQTSSATSKVGKGTLPKATVALSSDAPVVGNPVEATVTGWDAGLVPAPAYQWYRVDTKKRATKISGATAAGYPPVPADRGYWLKVVATGTATGYSTASAFATTASAVTVSG